MADITRLSRLLNGIQRGVDTSANTIVMSSLKLGTTELTKVVLDKLIIINNTADADGTYDSRYYGKTEVDNKLAAQDDASEISYTAGTLADWDGTADPGETSDGLDQLASRTKTAETTLSSHVGNTTNPHSVTKTQILTGNLIVNADIDAAASISYSKMAALPVNSALYADSSGIVQSHAAVSDVELGYLNGATSNLQSQINALDSGYSRRPKAIDYIADNTLAPPTEVLGDRYVLSHDGGVPHADWDGAAIADIVEFDGSNWIATTPVEGWVLYVDNKDKDYLFVDDGVGQWEARATQSNALSDGSVWIGNASNEATEQTISGDITVSNIGIAAISAGVIVNADVNAGAAIVESKLSLDFATSGLNTAITNHTGNTTNPHSVTKTQILTGNLIVNADVSATAEIATSKLADSSELAEAVTFFGNTDITAADAETLTDGSNADALHSHSSGSLPMVAGEVFAANTTYIVRIAISGETVGRVYKTDFDASVSNKFYAFGVVTPTVATAVGDPIEVYVSGIHTIGALSSNFESGEAGQAVHIKAAGSWDAISQIAYNTNEASFRIGIVVDVNKILLSGFQLLGIN